MVDALPTDMVFNIQLNKYHVTNAVASTPGDDVVDSEWPTSDRNNRSAYLSYGCRRFSSRFSLTTTFIPSAERFELS